MVKTQVSEWSLIPIENSDVGGIPLGEGVMLISHTNNAFREMMAQIRAANDNVPTPEQMAQVRRKNLVVNPSFQISQENGDTLGTSNGYCAADQHFHYRLASGGAASFQRIQQRSLYGSVDQLEWKCTTAKVSLAATDFVTLTHYIEGRRAASLAWGTAEAKPLVDTFEISGPAGTLHLHYQNELANRHYCAPVIIEADEANTPVRKTVVVPGDTTGTWATGTGIGIIRDLVLAVGNNMTGAAGVWGGTTVLAANTQANLMGNTSNVVRIADMGMYADPAETGLAPDWEAPDADDEEWACRRFYWKVANDNVSDALCNGGFTSTTAWTGVLDLDVPMRSAPSLVVSNQADFQAVAGSALDTTALSIATASTRKVRLQATVSGATAGQAAFLRFDGSAGRYLALNARY